MPDFEQKGVGMRIGLDIATFCKSKAVDRLALITADTDCIPAMKHRRIAASRLHWSPLPAKIPRKSCYGTPISSEKSRWPAP
jgi:hypothetical protein